MPDTKSAEHQRLADSEARKSDWKNWGPYLAERAWGTVREDYSNTGDAWDFFPHDHARSRAYRWNEDGIGGFCNRFQNCCLGLALWNENDPILKERFFGLSGPQGNHGEDVKEYYFYLDSTPTHSYAKMLYKYPHGAFPYDELVNENAQRGQDALEFELLDALSDAFGAGRYFDIFIEYAKADDNDMLCRISVINRGKASAPIHLVPHIWYRNTWSWGYNEQRPSLEKVDDHTVRGNERHLGERFWYVQAPNGLTPTLLFTENDTNSERLFGTPNPSPYVKDGINDYIVNGLTQSVNPAHKGTKAAAHIQQIVGAGETFEVWVRYSPVQLDAPFIDFAAIFAKRIQEADDFYTAIQPANLSDDEKRVQRQAFAGLLWTKQFYHYSVELWLNGDPNAAKPPDSRQFGRNANWKHLYNLDVISMPDKWEYPWYAAWDLAFHCIPLALIDPEWAKRQLILMLREWYMHPNGQIPAYEWEFGDVNPPVHAWAVWRVYKITRKLQGKTDTEFLERAFHKLLLNFTWWVNRKDADGNNIFQGGFLGLDNIGIFDRSAPLPTGGHLDQADGTAWMGMYCLNMLAIALELARTKPAYEDVATKFFEHFIYIADAITDFGSESACLWNEEDGFFYDQLHTSDGQVVPLKIRSFVGLIPLFAVETIEPDLLEKLPRFKRRMDWFIKYRPELTAKLASYTAAGHKGRLLLSIVDAKQLQRILGYMLDPAEFLSDYGLRSLSKYHEQHPYQWHLDGHTVSVQYEPAESTSQIFGGNSNWRGPIWFPVNYLMIESLQKYHHYFGDNFTVKMPSTSANNSTLNEVAANLSQRLTAIFLQDNSNQRPVFGGAEIFQANSLWHDHLLFYEYFHGDNGAGIGASHQTGWTALVAKLIQQSGGT
jgi:hypothetical protein